MPRAWIWLQLLLGWLPVGALFVLMFLVAHGGSFANAALIATQMMLTAALLGLAVYRYTQRVPWPHPLHLRFVASHAAGAAAYAFVWMASNVVIASTFASIAVSARQGGLALALVLGPG